MHLDRHIIRNHLKRGIELADRLLINSYLKFFNERPSILIFLFHKVFETQKDIDRDYASPTDVLLLNEYRLFIEYFLNCGYQFVSLGQLKQLKRDKKYACLTFDDGYFNNSLMLSLLEEYNIPCTFFISSNHIKFQKGFWWDCLYRARRKQGRLKADIFREERFLRSKTHHEIEAYLNREFGNDVLEPVGDHDRPFTSQELKSFSAHPLVHIGNHTSDHTILTGRDPSFIRTQIVDAQETLKDLTGSYPTLFSYPCGKYNDTVISIIKDLGFDLGVTVEPKKINIQKNINYLTLGRFYFASALGMKHHCKSCRSDISFVRLLRSLRCYLDI